MRNNKIYRILMFPLVIVRDMIMGALFGLAMIWIISFFMLGMVQFALLLTYGLYGLVAIIVLSVLSGIVIKVANFIEEFGGYENYMDRLAIFGIVDVIILVTVISHLSYMHS